MNSKNRFILINLMAFEFILLNVVLVVFLYLRLPEFSLNDATFISRMGILALVYNLSWLFIVLYIRDTEFYFNPDYGYFKSLFISLFVFVGFVMTLVVLLKISYFNRSTFIIPIFIFSYLNLIIHKYLLRYLKKRGSHLFSTTVLIGSGYKNSKLKEFKYDMAKYGYNVIGYLENGVEKSNNALGFNLFGGINDLANMLMTNAIDEIFIDMSNIEQKKIMEAIKIADSFGIRVKIIPENPLLMSKKYKVETMGGLALFKLRQSPLDTFNKMIFKRLFDFCFALVVIILFSPLFLLISILIFIESGGPILYSPIRKGEAGEKFRCYKFRTMSDSDDPVSGTKSTIVNDPRITLMGKILRKSDLDELPQFINVLIGNMSVIGPRPHRVNLQNDFRKSINNYMVRSYIKPGITGWAQVNGWRGPTVTEEQKKERISHDLWYIENWSFWLDLKIVFLTLFGQHHLKAF